jgi:nitric oxide reductase subunit B
MARIPMPISRWWLQGAILTYLFGFTVLGILTYLTYAEQPPIPERVVTPDGTTLFTGEDVFAGMNVFQRYGLMEYGTIYGHGAYLGPDFTADYLHRAATQMIADRTQQGEPAGIAREQVTTH